MSPQQIAEDILGQIQWDSPTHGLCRCPGEASHTTRTGPRHCEVYIDGAPTIHCFHANCRPAVEGANRRLRQALSTWPASSSLPILPGRREGPCGAANRGLSLRRQQADQVTSALEERAPEILEELA